MGSCEGDDIRLPDHRSTDVFYSARIGLGYRYFWEQILDITIKAIMLQGIHRFAHMHVCLCIQLLLCCRNEIEEKFRSDYVG